MTRINREMDPRKAAAPYIRCVYIYIYIPIRRLCRSVDAKPTAKRGQESVHCRYYSGKTQKRQEHPLIKSKHAHQSYLTVMLASY